jgi:competence/damage-inducible protein CinA-like protein
MAICEIVTIGTELLLGEIHDTNSRFIARALRDIGVDLYRLTTVGDNLNRITATLQEALMRADIVITTGGLGPTVDDPTRQAVANVFNVKLVYKEELWQQIYDRFSHYNRIPTENNKRQAFIPQNSIAIPNPVGTAPAFYVELGVKTIISLPGVPREMEYLMNHFVVDYLKKRYDLRDEIILPWVIHTVSKGESSIDEIIGEMEKLSNPTVGLLAHPGQTDIRVTAKAPSAAEAEAMMAPVLQEIREKLKDYIYGENETTLEKAVADMLNQTGTRLSIIESGTSGTIYGKLRAFMPEDNLSGDTVDLVFSEETLNRLINEYREQKKADMVLGVVLSPRNADPRVQIAMLHNGKLTEINRLYGGPSGDALTWAINVALDMIRREFIQK